ncbi:hypothetical protein FBU31_003690 [Coemansia sp. 'formosensis']|nr:hypothetical protein FBU31_003690 [Coemansia sp. 'formosensis']
MTISEKKQACMRNLVSANKAATRVAQIKSPGFIRSIYGQHRMPISHWLLGAVAVQPSQCLRCGEILSRDHAADCIDTITNLSSNIAATSRNLCEQQRQCLLQANAIDAVLMVLKKNDVASAIRIALVIGNIYTQCFGRRSLIKQLTPCVLE